MVQRRAARWTLVPCFPTQKTKVVEPERGTHLKNVHRYGETHIRHVQRPLRPEEWKKSERMRNAGRPLPNTPAELEEQRVAAIRRQKLQKQTPVQSESESYSHSENRGPPVQKKVQRPVKADFFISVPIFNERIDHSYRKKNEYVYADRKNEDTASLLHHSLSRSSSTYDVSRDRPPSGSNHGRSRRRVKSGSLSHRSHSHDSHIYENDYHDYNRRAKSARPSERRYNESDKPRPLSSRRPRRVLSDRQKYSSGERLSQRGSDREHYVNLERKHYSTAERQYGDTDRQHYVNVERARPLPASSDRQNYSTRGGNFMTEERSHRQLAQRPLGKRRQRPLSGSEVSHDTMASTATSGSYIYEEMPAAYNMRRVRSTGGLVVDSDEDDRR